MLPVPSTLFICFQSCEAESTNDPLLGVEHIRISSTDAPVGLQTYFHFAQIRYQTMEGWMNITIYDTLRSQVSLLLYVLVCKRNLCREPIYFLVSSQARQIKEDAKVMPMVLLEQHAYRMSQISTTTLLAIIFCIFSLG